MIDREHIERQIVEARKLEAQLQEEAKPYLSHFRIASRVKRKLAKVRKARREMEKVLQDNQ